MSTKLLHHLNGETSGLLDAFIKRSASQAPRICWYPSAGHDLRDLFFLSAAYQQHDPARTAGEDWYEPVPDLFLHTDYWPLEEPWFTANPQPGTVLFADHLTTVTVLAIERLPDLVLPLSPALVERPEGSALTGQVYFMEVEASGAGPTIRTHLLYAFVENFAFFQDVLLPCAARISHVISNRSGGSFGGGRSHGHWLTNALESLQSEVFITDGRHGDATEGDRAALAALRTKPRFRQRYSAFFPGDRIRSIPGTRWSGYGETVDWLRRTPDPTTLRKELVEFLALPGPFREAFTWRALCNAAIQCSLTADPATPQHVLAGIGPDAADRLVQLILHFIEDSDRPEHLVKTFSLIAALDRIAPGWIDAQDLLGQTYEALQSQFGYDLRLDLNDPAAATVTLLLHCTGLGFLAPDEIAAEANRETTIRALLRAIKDGLLHEADILRLALFIRSKGAAWDELSAIERSMRH